MRIALLALAWTGCAGAPPTLPPFSELGIHSRQSARYEVDVDLPSGRSDVRRLPPSDPAGKSTRGPLKDGPRAWTIRLFRERRANACSARLFVEESSTGTSWLVHEFRGHYDDAWVEDAEIAGSRLRFKLEFLVHD